MTIVEVVSVGTHLLLEWILRIGQDQNLRGAIG
jgi:hypothetical protein